MFDDSYMYREGGREGGRRGDLPVVGRGTAYIPPRIPPDGQSGGRAPGRYDRDDRGRPSHSRATER